MIPFVYFLFAVYPSAFRGGQLRERGAEAARSRAMMRRTPGWHAAVLPLSTGSCLPSPRRAHVCPRRRTIPWSPARPTPLASSPIHARRHTAPLTSRNAMQRRRGEGRGALHLRAPLTGRHAGWRTHTLYARAARAGDRGARGTGTGTPYVNVMYRTKKRAVPRARWACGQRHSTKAGGGDPSQLSTDAFPFRFTTACDEKYPWNLESSLSIHMRNKLLSIWIFSGSKYPTW